MNRREFIGSVGAGLLLSSTLAGQSERISKNWAWLRRQVTDVDGWRRMLASLKRTGFDAILIGGDADFYQKHVPLARDEGPRAARLAVRHDARREPKAHPEWYAVSRTGVSTAIKPPYVDYYKFMCPSRDEVRAYLRGIVSRDRGGQRARQLSSRLHSLPGRHPAGRAMAEVQPHSGQGISGVRLLLLRRLP